MCCMQCVSYLHLSLFWSKHQLTHVLALSRMLRRIQSHCVVRFDGACSLCKYSLKAGLRSKFIHAQVLSCICPTLNSLQRSVINPITRSAGFPGCLFWWVAHCVFGFVFWLLRCLCCVFRFWYSGNLISTTSDLRILVTTAAPGACKKIWPFRALGFARSAHGVFWQRCVSTIYITERAEMAPSHWSLTGANFRCQVHSLTADLQALWQTRTRRARPEKKKFDL